MKASIAFLLCCVCLIACKKKDSAPDFPTPTHSGSNAFACKIDGMPFVVNGKSNNTHPYGVDFLPASNGRWYARAKQSDISVIIYFNYGSNTTPGTTFVLNDDYFSEAHYFNYDDGTVPSGGNTFKTDSTHTGTVTLTHYTNSYASGTFEMDVVNEEGEVVHITDGWFDIRY